MEAHGTTLEYLRGLTAIERGHLRQRQHRDRRNARALAEQAKSKPNVAAEIEGHRAPASPGHRAASLHALRNHYYL